MSYIQFESINKFFGENHVLKDINLGIEEGELVTLLGPSGCGKSTLLRCLAGLETVSSGKIYLDGKDITNLTPKQRQIGMVFQQYSLFPNMTVAQNVAFGLQIRRMDKKTISDKVRWILDIVGLSEKYGEYPNRLSGGQQQRVALARALVMEPKVLLLDEPLSAIDALLRRGLQTEIRRIQKEFNITSIFVTHDQDEAMVMSDTIHLFNVGVLEQSGHPVDIYTHPTTRFAATFIGHYNILSAKTFGDAVGDRFDCQDVAIRPEIVELSAKPFQDSKDAYTLDGVIKGNISHGNIIRYEIDCGTFSLTSDILFVASLLFNTNETVYLRIQKSGCLVLD